MLRKACISSRKDQPMPESGGTSFLPGLLVGFAKGMADADSARSPTSPLDCRLFSGLGSHFAPSPGAADAARKSWGRDRVGLGLVDSLGGDGGECCRRVLLGSPENRRILLGSQTRIDIPCPKTRLDRLLADENSAASPKSLPKNYVIFSHNRNNASPCFKPGGSPEKVERASAARLELDEHGNNIQPRRSPHIRRSPSPSSEPKNAPLISPPFAEATKFETCSSSLPDDLYGFLGSLSADDIEQSEDYTCIISHGPNPKTTRIFGGCVLESRRTGAVSGCSDGGDRRKGEEGGGCLWTVKCFVNPTTSFPAAAGEDFLRICFSCKKKLEGEDIYIYRGEKAFCSSSCRSREMMMSEEETEGPAPMMGCSSCLTPPTSCCEEEIFLSGGSESAAA